jgi:hypothetical protein
MYTFQKFWAIVMEKTGKFDETLLNLLKYNGFNSVLAFEGFFSGENNMNLIVEGLEQSVGLMTDEDLTKCVDLRSQTKERFKLNFGQKTSLSGLFKAIQKMISNTESNADLSTTTAATVPSISRAPTSSRRVINAENLQEMINRILSPKIKQKFNETIDNFQITERSSSSYPMVVCISCYRCGKSVRIRVSRECKREKNYYYLRSDNYMTHIMQCQN